MRSESEQKPTTRRYELVSAAMLGFGHLCLMVGYDSESFVLESVIHSIHERDPAAIGKYAGYYGQAVMYIVYMAGCLFSPSILNQFGSKRILIAAAVCFAAFPLGFFFTNPFYYYFSQMLLGLGYALYYQGHGGFLTSHSTRKTIGSNVSVAWSVGCCCFIVTSGIFAGITTIATETPSLQLNTTVIGNLTEDHQFERTYSDFEIRLLFAVFFGASVLGIVNFILIPGNDVTNCIEGTEKQGSFWSTFKLTSSTVFSPNILLLSPLFTAIGTTTSFWVAVFSTAMNFTRHNSDLIYLPAVYSLGIGIGEVFSIQMGVLITQLTRRFKDFSLRPAMLIGTLFTVTSCTLVHLSTPFDSPIRPTSLEPILFHHSYPFILLLGLLVGIGDCCLNSCRSVICALALPDRRAQAFSISKLYQALGACVLFFLSPIIPLQVYTIGISIHCILALFLFFSVTRRTQSMERKLTSATLEPTNSNCKQ